jgi:hypothetical protein
MKRLLLIALVVCLLVLPVTATTVTFQNPADVNYGQSVGASPIITYYPNLTGGNSYAGLAGNWMNKYPQAMTYAAVSSPSNAYYMRIDLYDSAKNNMGGATMSEPAGWARWEFKMVGGHGWVYSDPGYSHDLGALAQNPSYVAWGNGYSPPQTSMLDDMIWGDTDDKTVLDMPQPNAYYIKKDMVNPAASGFYNATTGALMYSSAMPFSFSRTNLSGESLVNQSIYFINENTGTVYSTQYTGTDRTAVRNINITDVTSSATAPYGWYKLHLGTSYSDRIAYIADGAEISWNKKAYTTGDTATITYSVDSGGYWNPGTNTYSIKIVDAYGNLVNSQVITSQSGTVTYTWTDSQTAGVYYAEIVATPKAGGSDILMNFDYTSLQAYITFYGYVNNAQNATPISGANVSVVQGSIVSNSITTADGNYTASGFYSGSSTAFNITATGYSQYNVTFVPLATKTIYLNISLNSTSPVYTGLGIGGIARDGIFSSGVISNGYGRPISGATVYLKNTTSGELYTKTTNNAGWYLCDEGASCFLTTKRPYNVWGQKLGYSNSPNYTVVAA